MGCHTHGFDRKCLLSVRTIHRDIYKRCESLAPQDSFCLQLIALSPSGLMLRALKKALLFARPAFGQLRTFKCTTHSLLEPVTKRGADLPATDNHIRTLLSRTSRRRASSVLVHPICRMHSCRRSGVIVSLVYIY
jgi:hypothetical protein